MLKHTDTRSSNRHCASRGVELPGGFGADLVGLGVHGMVFGLLHAYRLKRTEADVQGDLDLLNIALLELRKNLPR